MLSVEQEIIDYELSIFQQLLQHHAEASDGAIAQVFAVVEDLNLQHFVGFHRTSHGPFELLGGEKGIRDGGEMPPFSSHSHF